MLAVNSSLRFDWTAAHFGVAPGRTRFYHTLLRGARYVKLFRPNPVRLPDGTWRERTADAEAVFYLAPAARSRFEGVFEGELAALGVPGEVEWIREP
jgi:hypothetical protein